MMTDKVRRTPQGVRGLKYGRQAGAKLPQRSHPARGAWIEIGQHRRRATARTVAPRKGCVD